MFLTVAATFGLVIWIVLWSIGVKGFDAFMLTALVLFLAATVRIVLPSLPGNRTD
ncbi:hypothetical protein [Capillimicrobium parvum]|uniref:Uncharacterized protein n=1 Tax=Capillimicrobium parvum TaxID=2884022 RepID=A0A9E7C2C4_9ACTN|nr:hypothetical protein [Capillimicrobium parvum]UGS37482.1 hypothetical protein DSM104329_03898 [Capillimicrobium parvum]